MKSTAVSTGSGPASIMCCSDSPSTNSITNAIELPSRTALYSSTMFGWWSRACTWISRSNLCTCSGSLLEPGGSSFIASTRLVMMCSILYTAPMPPEPAISITR